MSQVQLTGIHKAFGGKQVLRGIDLSIHDGEFLVMLGPSGCGKSTLLRILSGLETSDRGDIVFDGKRVNDVAPQHRNIGMVFQSYALYPHMTVRENLAFGLTLRKLPPQQIAERVAAAAKMLGIEELLDSLPKAMSGGQRQRVAMGRAICKQPSLFLFDEPLSNLDTALRVHMRGELARLHQQLATTMIYVTHDQVEAMTLATRVAVFHEGKLQQIGPPLELYNRPTNRFVASFLGSPSMNLFPAACRGELVAGSGFELPQPPKSDARGEVLLGLRPQDLRIANEGPFHGVVETVERLGFDGFAYVKTAAGPLVCRFERTDLRVGENVRVAMTHDAIHLFSADGSTALRHPPESYK